MTSKIKIKELSKIIVEAVEKEPFFSKDALVPKVASIISGFRIKLEDEVYNNIENPSKIDNLIFSNRLQEREKQFYKEQLRLEIGQKRMLEKYKECDKIINSLKK